MYRFLLRLIEILIMKCAFVHLNKNINYNNVEMMKYTYI